MNEPQTATGVLRREHQLILSVLGAFEKILDGAPPPPRDGQGPGATEGSPSPVPVDDFEDCLTFFRSFTDACHHAKEEDVLFHELEELARRIVARTGG